jgi:hypothetical protein
LSVWPVDEVDGDALVLDWLEFGEVVVVVCVVVVLV